MAHLAARLTIFVGIIIGSSAFLAIPYLTIKTPNTAVASLR